MSLVGVLGGSIRADVDALGNVAPHHTTWHLDWWIGADDRWRMPARETAVRQVQVDDVPVVQTAMRVPGGDAIERVYGVGIGGRDVIVLEIENASPAPFVAALVVRGAQSVAVEDAGVVVDRGTALVAPRAPSRWAVARGGTTEVEVCSGAARSGPFPATQDRAGRIEAALLHPVPHRTTLRVGLTGPPMRGALPIAPDDLRRAPAAAAAARGWKAQLDRGLRVVLPDERLSAAVRAARGQALLATTRPTADDAMALEDWGFDAEAAEAWDVLSGRERKRAARRPTQPSTWTEVRDARSGSALLVALRGLLAHEHDDDVTLLAELPAEWRGQPVEVHDAPTRRGPLSYAVRWHGARPALLWDAPPGVTLRAPGLDPGWSTSEPAGEALLAGMAA